MRAFVEMKPVPKGRPRFSKHAYTPQKTRDAEAFIRSKLSGITPIDGDCKVVIELYGKTRLRGDCDNYAKLITDSLNGIAYKDDRQIVSLNITKSIHPIEGFHISVLPI